MKKYLFKILSFVLTIGSFFVFADNENQALRINEILKEFSNPQKPGVVPLCVLPDAVSKGFSIPEAKILVTSQTNLAVDNALERLRGKKMVPLPLTLLIA